MRRVALATTTLALVAGWDEPFANIYRGLDTAGRVRARRPTDRVARRRRESRRTSAHDARVTVATRRDAAAPHAQVEAELNRSLADYAQIETPGAAERLVVRLLSDPRRSAPAPNIATRVNSSARCWCAEVSR